MFFKSLLRVVAVSLLAFGAIRPAQAQFAVIDVAALTQLIQEYETLQQELTTAKSQLNEAQAQYSAITGNRGMQNLLSGSQRNYLPTDWAQVSQALSGSGATYPALSTDVRTLMGSNAILTPGQIGTLSSTQQSQLAAARQSPAIFQAISREALANSSNRFASLQQLIAAIGGAADEKASLDLNARIAAEQGMLENEHTKLEALYRVAESDEWARLQRLREQAIADQGSLRQLPPLGL